MSLVDRLKYLAREMQPSGLGGVGRALDWKQHTILSDAAAEIERLRAALTEIAEDQKTYLGHGAYDEGPLPGDYCQKLARKTLAFHNERSDKAT